MRESFSHPSLRGGEISAHKKRTLRLHKPFWNRRCINKNIRIVRGYGHMMEDPGECLTVKKKIETLLTFDIEARIGPKSHCEESYTERSKKNNKNSNKYGDCLILLH